MKLRLAVVLELRRSIEDTIKREVGHLERQRAETVALQTAIEQDFQLAVANPTRPELRQQLAAYLTALRAAAAEAITMLAAHDERILEARGRLAAAHRDVRAIEALQERDRIAKRKINARREGYQNDEFSARKRLEATP
ncbi:MAG: flagellar FliJ family protein [Planctomycetota bacterium]